MLPHEEGGGQDPDSPLSRLSSPSLGRRLCISRVASSFARSPSIRSRTARISKAELCSDNGPADATRLFTQCTWRVTLEHLECSH